MADFNLSVGLESDLRDSQQSLNKLERTLQNSSRRMTQQTNKMSKAFKAAFAGMSLAASAAMGKIIADSIRLASAAEEINSKFNVVFGELSDQTNKWATEFGSAVGRSVKDIKEWVSGLQDTFVPLGFARDEAARLSTALVELGVDVASFNNKADADVLRDFQSALVGNTETVRKYGIVITQSVLEQESYNSGLNKSFKDLTELEKVQLRYNLILKNTQDAQGDAVRTGDSYANQVKRLEAAWTDLRVEIGKQFLPVLTEFVSGLNEFLKTTGPAIIRYFHDFAEGVEITGNALKYVSDTTDDIGKNMTKNLAIDIVGDMYKKKLEERRNELFMAIQDPFSRFPKDLQDGKINVVFGLDPELDRKINEAMKPGGALADKDIIITDITAIKEAYEQALEKVEEFNMKLIREDIKNIPISPAIEASNIAQAREEAIKAVEEMKLVAPDPFRMGFDEPLISTFAEKIQKDKERKILKDAQDFLETLRNNQNLTYSQRIKLVKDYEFKHKESLQQVGEAEELLNRRIINLAQTRFTRLDALALEYREIMEDNLDFIDDKFASFFETMEGSFSNAITRMIIDGESFSDAMTAITREITRAFIQMAADIVVRSAFASIFGSAIGTSIGMGGAQKGYAPGEAVVGPPAPYGHSGLSAAYVPKLHTGLRKDEFPAILQTGETVLKRGDSRAEAESDVTVNIINQSSQPVRARQIGTRREMDQYVIDLLLEDASSGGTLSRQGIINVAK